MAVHLTSRRLIAVGGFALAAATAPALAVLSPANVAVAAPTCQITQTNGSASLACPPGQVTAGIPVGAPSEEQLTATNTNRRGPLGGIL